MKIDEPQSLASEAVKVWGADLAAELSEIRVPQIVGDDQQDVRLAREFCCARRVDGQREYLQCGNQAPRPKTPTAVASQTTRSGVGVYRGPPARVSRRNGG